MTVTNKSLAPTSPVAERALFGWPKWSVYEVSASGAASTPTLAGVVGRQHVIYKVIISFSATLPAAIEATLADATVGTLLPIEIPAATLAPVALDFGLRGLPITQGAAWTLTVPLSAGVVTTAVVVGDTIVSP